MGDTGSQFLGFTLGFLAVFVTQRVHTALSPAVTLLFLGLPVIDIIAVLIQRIYHKMNWFRGTRNHIHHRLLDLGFNHDETVVIIYGIQACFVISAILLRYESDWVILWVYSVAVVAIFGTLIAAERSGWRRRQEGAMRSPVTAILDLTAEHAIFRRYPYYAIAWTVPLYVLGLSLFVHDVPRDFAVTSAVLGAVLLVELLLGRQPVTFPMRGATYVAIVFAAYLGSQDEALRTTGFLEGAFFALMAIAIGLTVRYADDQRFRTTPMDYLILAGVATAAVFGQGQFEMKEVSLLIVRAVILLYACELILERTFSRWSLLNIASTVTLAVFAYKGLIAA